MISKYDFSISVLKFLVIYQLICMLTLIYLQRANISLPDLSVGL